MNHIAIIPAYEPDQRLLPLLKEVKEAGFRAIVVDDGSGDAYNDIFTEASSYAEVFRYTPNQGKGHALKYAFSKLQEQQVSSSVLVTMDSDGQHTVRDALRLCSYIEEHPEELVLGSRKRDNSVPLRSRFGNGITKAVFHLVTGCKVYDTQTGLRAFSDAMLPKLLEVDGDRYEYEMNMLMSFSQQKITITELPIEVLYFDSNKGSHFHAWKDSWKIYKAIFKFMGKATPVKFVCSSLISFLVDYTLYSILTALFGFSVGFNIAARVVSASLNFSMNRYIVFRQTGKVQENFWLAALKYAVLATCILAANTGLLYCLVKLLGWNEYLSKILVEICLYIVSYFVQKTFVYYKKK